MKYETQKNLGGKNVFSCLEDYKTTFHDFSVWNTYKQHQTQIWFEISRIKGS